MDGKLISVQGAARSTNGLFCVRTYYRLVPKDLDKAAEAECCPWPCSQSTLLRCWPQFQIEINSSHTAQFVVSRIWLTFHYCSYAMVTYTFCICKNAIYLVYFIMQYIIMYALVYSLCKARRYKYYSHHWWVNCHQLYNDVKIILGASLVAQWLGVCLLMQGTRVRDLVWEDPTCRGAAGPVSHNCWACASGACAPQRGRPRRWEARAPRWRVAPACRSWRGPSRGGEDPTQS